MVPSGTRRWTVLAVTLAVGLIAAALPAVGGRPAGAQAEVTVNIVDFAFDPATIEVPVGTTVTWVNQGQAPHTATSDDGGATFDSSRLDTGGSYSYTFDTPGTFAYHCDFHPDMVATIVVVEAQPVDEPPATEPAATEPPADGGQTDGGGFAPVEQVAPVAVPHLAHIHAGTCDELGIVVFALSDVRTYALAGAAEGGGDVQVLVGTARVELPELFTEPFSIHVHKSEAEKSVYIACAEIGGPPPAPWQPSDGFAVPMVEQQDSGESGIASLKPDSGGATTATLLLAGGATTAPPVEETPPPEGQETPAPDDEETPAASVPGTYVSPTFGYTLSYGQAWTVQEESSDGRQDRLELTNGASFVTFIAAQGFGGEPEQCVSGFSEERVADPAVGEVTLATDAAGNPLRGGTEATGAFAVYNHTYTFADGRTEPYTLFIGCIPLVAAEAVLAVIQNVPTAQYNEQVEAREALLRGLTLPPR